MVIRRMLTGDLTQLAEAAGPDLSLAGVVRVARLVPGHPLPQ